MYRDLPTLSKRRSSHNDTKYLQGYTNLNLMQPPPLAKQRSQVSLSQYQSSPYCDPQMINRRQYFSPARRSQRRRVIQPGNLALVYSETLLPSGIEDEIKEGFFELKPKFTEQQGSIYISHQILHSKHPFLKKLDLKTLKLLITLSKIVYLDPGQTVPQSEVHFVIFGRLTCGQHSATTGWTLNEDILFETARKFTFKAKTESCLLAISKLQLSVLQHTLHNTNIKDFYCIQSTLEGNNLMKQQWA